MDAADLLGEWHPLVEQLGSSEGLLPLSQASAALRVPGISHRSSLVAFLESYKARVLIPHELPAILRAYLHATRQETRELIAFDRSLSAEEELAPFARASQRVGQFQLKKLRPLRDHRPLQRYLRAVETEQASGWHTLVYGLTLSIYSLPVRLARVGLSPERRRSVSEQR
jgi:urease accessory protein UreF